MSTTKATCTVTFVAMVTVLTFAVLGCGGAGHRTTIKKAVTRSAVRAPVEASSSVLDADGDHDGVSGRRYDADENGVVGFGSAADPQDATAVSALLRRYYSIAARGDGAIGCSLIYSVLAEAIVEDYGTSLGSRALKGDTCAVVMSKLFKQEHKELAKKAKTLRVNSVRVSGRRGIAILTFDGSTDRYISVQHERNRWKLDALLDVKFP